MRAGVVYKRLADRARGTVKGWGPDAVDMEIDGEGPTEPVAYKALAHEWEQVTAYATEVAALSDEVEALKRKAKSLIDVINGAPGRDAKEQEALNRIAELVCNEPEATPGRAWLAVAADVLQRFMDQSEEDRERGRHE